MKNELTIALDDLRKVMLFVESIGSFSCCKHELVKYKEVRKRRVDEFKLNDLEFNMSQMTKEG